MPNGRSGANDFSIPNAPWVAPPLTRALERLRRIRNAARQRAFRKSYSQFGEDLYCLQFLPEAQGHYLDIGSGHPVRGSNTFLLYQRGWSGILVDPIQRYANIASRRRRRDSFLRGILGLDAEEGSFYEFTPSEISTVSRQHAVDLIARHCGRLLRVDPMGNLTWSDLNLTIEPEEPFLLSIDVETAEMSVLKSLDFTSFQPRVICIEDSEGAMLPTTSVQNHLSEIGYLWAGAVGPSRIMVHTRYLKLQELI